MPINDNEVNQWVQVLNDYSNQPSGYICASKDANGKYTYQFKESVGLFEWFSTINKDHIVDRTRKMFSQTINEADKNILLESLDRIIEHQNQQGRVSKWLAKGTIQNASLTSGVLKAQLQLNKINQQPISNSKIADANLVLEYVTQLENEKKFDEAFKYLQYASTISPTANLRLGDYYLEGKGGAPKNVVLARECYEKVATKSDSFLAPQALFKIAQSYENIDRENLEQAAKLYHKAVELGYGPAAIRLGQLRGVGELGLHPEKYFKQAIKLGDKADGHFNIFKLSYHDIKKRYYHLRVAAKEGHEEAKRLLRQSEITGVLEGYPMLSIYDEKDIPRLEELAKEDIGDFVKEYATYHLALLYQKFRPNESQKIEELFKVSADQFILDRAGLDYGKKLLNEKRYIEAMKYIEDVNAMYIKPDFKGEDTYYLAKLWEIDIEYVRLKNIPHANELYLKAAKAGYSEAQYEVGLRYLHGLEGFQQDRNAAIAWLYNASRQGHEKAIFKLFQLGLTEEEKKPYNLGYYDFGYSRIPYEHDELKKHLIEYTAYWCNREQGKYFLPALIEREKEVNDSSDNIVHYWLGYAYLKGAGGVKVDPEKAYRYLDLAFKHGNPEAKKLIIENIRQIAASKSEKSPQELFEMGRVLFAVRKRDLDPEALKFFREAAEKGHVDSILMLTRYDTINQDQRLEDVEPIKAMEVYEKYPENIRALLYLGRLLSLDQDKIPGIKKDDERAIQLILKAHQKIQDLPQSDEKKVLLEFAEDLLGNLYEKGAGLSNYTSHAVIWYKTRASEFGYATYFLSQLVGQGLAGLEQDTQLARQLLEQSARQGYPKAQYDFGLSFLNQGPDKRAQGIVWLEEAARQWEFDACYKLYSLYREDHEEEKARNMLEKLSQNTNPYQEEATLKLGLLNLNEYPTNVAKAAELFAKGKEMGFQTSTIELAKLMAKGLGTAKNEAGAIKLLKEIISNPISTPQVVSEANMELANRYLSGSDLVKTEKNINAAIRILMEEKNIKNNPEAFFRLANLKSSGLSHDGKQYLSFRLDEANELYLKAAELGLAEAQLKVAELENDRAKKIEWYLKAASSGNAAIQYRVALEFMVGKELADPQIASRWLTSAAEQGHADAQYELALLYRDALEPNLDLAQSLLKKSAARGNQKAKMLLGI